MCPELAGRPRRGTHRPEHIALAEQVDDPIAFDEFDRPGANDENRVGRIVAIVQDHGPFGIKLDLPGRRHLLQALGFKVVERGVLG